MALMVTFDPRFEIMPGTKDRSARLPQDEAFEADVGVLIPE